MDERPKCKTGPIKILEENLGSNLFDLGHSNFLLGMSQEARETKTKMNYWENTCSIFSYSIQSLAGF